MPRGPVAVAEQQKIFSKYNLDVEFVNFGNSTDVLLEAIATGKADAGVGMALRWLKALEQGFDVKLTAGTHGGCLNLLTAKDSPFGGLESLKGQTIGVTDMAGPDKNFFAILLKRHGIDPISDVQWKVYPADLLSVALGQARNRRHQRQRAVQLSSAGDRQVSADRQQYDRGLCQPQLLRAGGEREPGAGP
ncbi:nitrate/sulfonate/bicarbonate ABC transporter periplasmic protein [Klebsiella pneumoniae]|uniref:Nitrate/sulfonate/bicarbonate ABC transporter periplasmic protein n=1 Tax=Klebsiella pneumoniae TaxID=573 RepID=A0A377XC31_KLEPN|nr:nitrate/sulfonate/bicarbonate ABC transporter periplasmic protein [Klebsiella pneumoniae]